MPNTPDEARLKELLKSAVVEVLEERPDLIRNAMIAAKGIRAAVPPPATPVWRLIAIWILILVFAVGLYNFLEHVPSR